MNLKELNEQRADLQAEMENILNSAKAEQRDLTSDEAEKFDNCENKIREIDSQINEEEKRETMENTKVNEISVEQRDYDAFADYIRSVANNMESTRASELNFGDNGAVIPTTIVNKIIEKVAEISPLYRLSTKYRIGGTVNIPVEDTSVDSITVAYGTEFTDLDSHANKFATVQLTGFVYGALVKISKSLLNNSNFDLVNWVIEKMAVKVAAFIDGELINGTASKTSGIARSYDNTNMKKTLSKKSSVTSDELVELQALVPDAFQSNACWIMSSATRTLIRKLRDGEGNYLLIQDFANGGAYTLLGKPVYVSDACDSLGTASKNVIFYGDMSGLAVKESEQAEAQVLREKYATQHAIGVVMWGEIDAKVEAKQKIAVAVSGTSDS